MADDYFDDNSLMEAIKEDVQKSKEPVIEKPITEQGIENKAPEGVVDNKGVLSNTEKQDTEIKTDKEEVIDEGDQFKIDSFNRKFKTEYTTPEEIQSLLESPKQLQELRASLTAKEKEILDKETLLNTKTDGLKLFADDNMYKINQILINNPDLNRGALLRLASANLEEMKDVEILKLQKLVNLKGNDYSEGDIEYAINKQYNLNADPNELEGDELREYNANKFLRGEAAQAARKELGKLMSVEMPEKIDLLKMESDTKAAAEKQFSDKLESWKAKSPEIIKALDKFALKFDEGDEGKFEFAYDDEFKAYLNKYVPELAARSNLDINNPESLKTLNDYIERDFHWRNKDKMFKSFREELLAKFEDKEYRKKHNIPDPNIAEAPDKITDIEKKDKAVNDGLAARLDQGYF